MKFTEVKLALGGTAPLEIELPGGARIITFDTKVYETDNNQAWVRGGGGTNVQAVEDYARNNFKRYPDVVIVFSDGQTPTPNLIHPNRWIWILPPWGTKHPIAPQSRIAFFNERAA